MNETEYLLVSNKAKVSAALQILSDVQPGKELGITQDELGAITSRLCEAQDRFFSMIETKD